MIKQKIKTKCGQFLMCFLILWTTHSAAENRVFSLRLKQAPMVATLQQLALEQNANLMIDDELEGTLSLQLDNVDFDRLLRSVAKIKGLSFYQENNIYYLGKPSQHEQYAEKMAEPMAISGESFPSETPLVSATVKLHFAKASDVMKSLTTGSGSLLSPSGTITFDDRSNVLLIQDDARSVKNIKKLIAELDKPIEQIVIEARIVTITDESLKELGVRGSLALQVAKINGRLLDLELTALERENNVEIIASPRLLTTNKKSASIKQGTEIPYVVTNGKNDTQSVEFREAVLGLEVTPHISKDNNILLDLLVSQNSPGNRVAYGQNEVVSIDKQEINTQVFAKDGETIVLGGVFHDTITKGIDKVPLLGDIPGIKRLFSKESERHQKRELVIFVTPHILKQGERMEMAKKEKHFKQVEKAKK